MENKKTVDQNSDEKTNPKENIEAVNSAVTKTTEEKNAIEAAAEDTAESIVAEKPENQEEPAPEVVSEEVAPEVKAEEKVEAAAEEKVEAAAEEKVPEDKAEEKVEVEAEGNVPEDKAEEKVEAEAEGNVPEDKAEEKVEAEAEENVPEDKAEEKVEETTDKADADVKEEEKTKATVEEAKVDEKAEAEEDDDDDEEDEDEEEDEDDDISESFDELSADELISRLEELVKEEDITTIKTKVALIKVAFLKILKEEKKAVFDKYIEDGGDKEAYNYEPSDIELRFKKAFDVYRKNKIHFNEVQEKIKIQNLEKKKEILDKLKDLISSEESLKKTYDEFRLLQTEWKEIGMVPSGEVSNLWQSYHFLVEKFFDKVKINKELRDLDMKKNLELKLELCEKTEELLLETSAIKSFKQLQKYHEEWKAIGPVPHEQNDELWERFKAATDRINELRREHYGQLQEEQEKNLLAKTDLCEQIEELLAIAPDGMKAWQEQTKKVTELFNIWRSIGRAPKKQNSEIWDRFKSSMNTFYSNKKEFLNSIKQEQLNNYNLKVDLCVEAETLASSTDWKKTTQELIRLQQEWKKIGPIPRKHSDKIWKRFRAACDEFFNNKASHFSGIHENEHQNLEKKKELIQKVKDFKFTDDKAKNLDILKEFQREWMAIGYVPMKDKEKVQKQFREAIDAALDKLKISSAELSKASYATRMESLKDSPDADRVYRKEIGYLNGKISQLRDDVNLWENNLGFFANSKNADILKQEFEQKIDKAKQDLAAMEAKVKYLRKMSS